MPFKLSHFLRQNNVLVIVQDAAINGDVDVRMLKLDEFLIFHRGKNFKKWKTTKIVFLQ